VNGDAAGTGNTSPQSLRRLGVDTIGLDYMRRRGLRVPIGETVEAMAERVQQGKVRHLGLSEVTAGELREASDVHPIAAVQSEGSIWSRDVERNVVPAAAELGVGFVPYSPLGRARARRTGSTKTSAP
jgi:aryl-alcohol dehydrogenase-like predicted oxidoreductase